MIKFIKSLFQKKDKKTIIFATPPNKENAKYEFKLEDRNELKSKYTKEKREGGKKRHQKTDIIKNQIIKPMFDNKKLIKSTSTKQRADRIEEILITIFSEEDEEELKKFAEKYNLDFNILQNSKTYILSEKGDTIYRWCLKFK